MSREGIFNIDVSANPKRDERHERSEFENSICEKNEAFAFSIYL